LVSHLQIQLSFYSTFLITFNHRFLEETKTEENDSIEQPDEKFPVCPTCHDVIDDTHDVLFCPQCKTNFHDYCLKPWEPECLKNGHYYNCPVCRKTFESESEEETVLLPHKNKNKKGKGK
jgi:methionyl-tRNA synthetase